MKRPLIPLLLVAALAMGAVLPAAAEKADRDKPMNAEADALRYDDLKQSSVFTGNVVITKGSTIIRGQQVDVSQDPEGYQQAVAVAAPGKLAYYRKKRDNVDEYIEGEGERIEYDSRADTGLGLPYTEKNGLKGPFEPNGSLLMGKLFEK